MKLVNISAGRQCFFPNHINFDFCRYSSPFRSTQECLNVTKSSVGLSSVLGALAMPTTRDCNKDRHRPLCISTKNRGRWPHPQCEGTFHGTGQQSQRHRQAWKRYYPDNEPFCDQSPPSAAALDLWSVDVVADVDGVSCSQNGSIPGGRGRRWKVPEWSDQWARFSS